MLPRGKGGEGVWQKGGGADRRGAELRKSPGILLGVDRKAEDGGHAHAALLFKLGVSLSAVLVPVLVGQNAEGCQQH